MSLKLYKCATLCKNLDPFSNSWLTCLAILSFAVSRKRHTSTESMSLHVSCIPEKDLEC